MAEAFAIPLREQPDVNKLLDLFKTHGHESEYQEYSALLDYVETVENRYASILDELTALREQINGIADKKNPAAVMAKRLSSVVSGILIQKIYEDNALGKLSDDRYVKMATAYEAEQKELSKRIADTKTRITEVKTSKVNFTRFTKIVWKYTDITELTPEILNELIEKIVIHECDYTDGERTQAIDVYYNFVGILPS